MLDGVSASWPSAIASAAFSWSVYCLSSVARDVFLSSLWFPASTSFKSAFVACALWIGDVSISSFAVSALAMLAISAASGSCQSCLLEQFGLARSIQLMRIGRSGDMKI
jgi:hypothetical protein